MSSDLDKPSKQISVSPCNFTGDKVIYGHDYGSAKKSHVPWSKQGPRQHFSSLHDLSKWVLAKEIQPAGLVTVSSTHPSAGLLVYSALL